MAVVQVQSGRLTIPAPDDNDPLTMGAKRMRDMAAAVATAGGVAYGGRALSIGMASNAAFQKLGAWSAYTVAGTDLGAAMSNSSVVINKSGRYLMTAFAQFDSNSGGNRGLRVAVGSVEIMRDVRASTVGAATSIHITETVGLVAGQLVDIFALQDSGANVGVGARFTIQRIDGLP